MANKIWVINARFGHNGRGAFGNDELDWESDYKNTWDVDTRYFLVELSEVLSSVQE